MDFPGARVLTFGYNADWFVKATSATAYKTACSLLHDLKEIKTEDKVRNCIVAN